jgi:CopA family copper-resistance protein
MKIIFLIIFNLLFSLVVIAQHMQMGKSTKMGSSTKRLPFYTKIGGREIYNLYIGDTTVNYTGKPRPALAINGTIPAPTLQFTEGDTAEIYVHNEMAMETSIHWHGLILPNRYDGVAYLTTAPIKPGETHKYKFPLVQHGTYWYHSHTMTQEQSGLYGAFIIRPKQAVPEKEYTLVLSDWTNENPAEVERSLHIQTDWYAIKKGSTQNYAEAISKGQFKTKLANEWKRMVAMDVSDVYYDKLFSNGKPQQQAIFKPGDQVRLHIVNGSSSTYFWLKYAGGKITVVANDGADVQPVKVDRLIIAVAETYDILVTIPKNGSYEFLATAEDRTKSTSLWLGSGAKIKATPLPRLNYFAGMGMMNDMMGMDGNMKKMDGMKMGYQVMDMNSVMYPEVKNSSMPADVPMGEMADDMEGMDMSNSSKTKTSASPVNDSKEKMNNDMAGMHLSESSKVERNANPANTKMKDDMPGMNMSEKPTDGLVTLNYGMLKSTKPTNLPPGHTQLLRFNLTGNMNRYVWTINNKTVSEADKILIKKGENVRIILYNNTMMRHPMHLHGHYFRVLNGQGDYSPLKNTLDIMPMETDTIEFAATTSGDWFFHCHILYHMMSGMGRIFSYENSPPNPEIPDSAAAIKRIYADDRRYYTMAKAALESNGTYGNLSFANTRWKLQTLWNLGLNNTKGYESETTIGRYIGQMQWLYAYAGFDYHYKVGKPGKNIFGQVSDKNNLHTAVAGLAYTLPMLVIADARVDANGKFRVQLGRDDIPITSRLRFSLTGNTDKEYSTGLRYIITKYFAISGHYDSDMGAGAGISLNY